MNVMDERDTLFERVNQSCKNLDSDNKLTWLMTNENVQILVQVSKMILKSGI